MTEIERLLLATKSFNTNLVHFLLLYHVIISNVRVCYFTGMISYMHRVAPKIVLHVRNLVYKI